jgi:hypothetical protein
MNKKIHVTFFVLKRKKSHAELHTVSGLPSHILPPVKIWIHLALTSNAILVCDPFLSISSNHGFQAVVSAQILAWALALMFFTPFRELATLYIHQVDKLLCTKNKRVSI